MVAETDRIEPPRVPWDWVTSSSWRRSSLPRMAGRRLFPDVQRAVIGTVVALGLVPSAPDAFRAARVPHRPPPWVGFWRPRGGAPLIGIQALGG